MESFFWAIWVGILIIIFFHFGSKEGIIPKLERLEKVNNEQIVKINEIYEKLNK